MIDPSLQNADRSVLLAKIEEQEQALNLARALRRSNEDLEQFAYAASHDLQEPLRKILGFGERLEEECGELLTPDGRDYLRRMLSAGHRMRALIQDLLSYSRLSTRLQTLFPVNLTTIAKQVIGDLELRIEQLQATIELKELPTVHADPVEMRQLLQNLISNALKFRKEEVPPFVAIDAKSLGTAWEIRVQDNGIGFDEKHLARMFAIFQRLHRRGEYEGNGIGLAICKKVVERHGGSISGRSTPGEGACFIVTLPARQARWDPSAAV